MELLHSDDRQSFTLRARPPTERRFLQHPHLGVVGLLDLLLVEVDLLLVLGPQLVQRLGQLALKLLLLPVVNLHHASLVPTFGLTQLLQTETGWGHSSLSGCSYF